LSLPVQSRQGPRSGLEEVTLMASNRHFILDPRFGTGMACTKMRPKRIAV
jgi:hypothetical protein